MHLTGHIGCFALFNSLEENGTIRKQTKRMQRYAEKKKSSLSLGSHLTTDTYDDGLSHTSFHRSVMHAHTFTLTQDSIRYT